MKEEFKKSLLKIHLDLLSLRLAVADLDLTNDDPMNFRDIDAMDDLLRVSHESLRRICSNSGLEHEFQFFQDRFYSDAKSS